MALQQTGNGPRVDPVFQTVSRIGSSSPRTLKDIHEDECIVNFKPSVGLKASTCLYLIRNCGTCVFCLLLCCQKKCFSAFHCCLLSMFAINTFVLTGPVSAAYEGHASSSVSRPWHLHTGITRVFGDRGELTVSRRMYLDEARQEGSSWPASRRRKTQENCSEFDPRSING